VPSDAKEKESVVVAIAVELRHISKRFPGVIANKDVSIKVESGSVHALIGENGAGKSTVMKILYGMQRPDGGEILVNGQSVNFKKPADSIEAGIGMVHQHFMLADNFTVLENIVLGYEPSHGGVIDFNAARTKINEMAAAYGLTVDPDALVEDLGVGQRQRVEILKVLYRGAKILIFDEPTAVLVPQEVDELFEALQGLRKDGLTVIFITHKLDEVLRVADDVTVIRAGSTVAEVKATEVSAKKLAELMVGSELPSPEIHGSAKRDEVTLSLSKLTVPAESGARNLVSDVSFTLHAGEVLGIAGVEGNGQSELIEAILGLRNYTGTVVFKGEPLDDESVSDRRDMGIGFIPEDRQRQALLMASPLWENRILGHQRGKPVMNGVLIDRKATMNDTVRIMQEFDVRAPGPDTLALALSGGNQQKFIVGREMSGSPSLLLASHPTRGVDVGAQAAIWNELRAAREKGMAIVLISADLEELIGLSDRLIVMLRGSVTAELDPAKTTPELLGSAMTGAA
jgi:simple sugar transport system ATP-binding protein